MIVYYINTTSLFFVLDSFELRRPQLQIEGHNHEFKKNSNKIKFNNERRRVVLNNIIVHLPQCNINKGGISCTVHKSCHIIQTMSL